MTAALLRAVTGFDDHNRHICFSAEPVLMFRRRAAHRGQRRPDAGPGCGSVRPHSCSDQLTGGYTDAAVAPSGK
jgi:hypothetical protein